MVEVVSFDARFVVCVLSLGLLYVVFVELDVIGIGTSDGRASGRSTTGRADWSCGRQFLILDGDLPFLDTEERSDQATNDNRHYDEYADQNSVGRRTQLGLKENFHFSFRFFFKGRDFAADERHFTVTFCLGRLSGRNIELLALTQVFAIFDICLDRLWRIGKVEHLFVLVVPNLTVHFVFKHRRFSAAGQTEHLSAPVFAESCSLFVSLHALVVADIIVGAAQSESVGRLGGVVELLER